MSGRCRSCGRRGARRHHRTVFSQGTFWLYLGLMIGVLWVYSETGGLR